MLKKIKDKLYYYFAEKNWGVRQEYGPYVEAHQEEHAKQPWKHWWLLLRLNWHYRVLRRTNPLTQIGIKNVEHRRGKLPYMDGAESTVQTRIAPIKLVISKLTYEVISFDIFDTLLLRPFAKPTDLFFIVGKRLDMPEFHRVRIETEKQLRETAHQLHGTWEITIEDIYEKIEERTGLSKELGIKTEFEVELQYCRANPYMKQVYQLFQEQGKTIILCTDMYLGKERIVQMLKKVGYVGYEKLYVSCEYGCSKSTKGLYKYVLNDFKGKKILHIGDNVKADIERANSCGIETLYYQNVHEVGNQYRADGMTALVGSAYAGIVNGHLHNGIRQYDPYYEYGFIYGGLYIFGFCAWMYRQAQEQRIEKILFLSRDGAIYKEVFDRFFGEVNSKYFLWSRVASIKYTTGNRKLLAFETSIESMIQDSLGVTIGDFLASYQLEGLIPYLGGYDLGNNSIIVRETVKKIEQLFCDHWDEVRKASSEQISALTKYIKDAVGTAKKIAVVDVGWLGSGPTALKNIITKEMKMECSVACWVAGATSTTKANITADLMDESIKAYLFWAGNNSNHYSTHVRTNRTSRNRLNNMFIEMFTQACHPSFSGFDNSGEMKFNLPEVENYRKIAAIHQGIIDFCKIYYETFQNDPFMFMIPGYDAYCPFRMAIRNRAFFKNNFADFAFPQVIGAKIYRETVNTVGELIDIK